MSNKCSNNRRVYGYMYDLTITHCHEKEFLNTGFCKSCVLASDLAQRLIFLAKNLGIENKDLKNNNKETLLCKLEKIAKILGGAE